MAKFLDYKSYSLSWSRFYKMVEQKKTTSSDKQRRKHLYDKYDGHFFISFSIWAIYTRIKDRLRFINQTGYKVTGKKNSSDRKSKRRETINN